MTAVRGVDGELIREEVERDRDEATVNRQRKRGEPAGRDLQGGVPVMVRERRQAERQLADDLRPHVERGVGVAPPLERQGRPEVAGRDVRRHRSDLYVVHEAVTPVLARLERLHDRVVRRAGMVAGVAVG